MFDPNTLPAWPAFSRRLLLALYLSLAISCASATHPPPAATPSAPAEAAHSAAAQPAANAHRVLVPNPAEVRLLLARYADGPYFGEVAAIYAEARNILAQKAAAAEKNAAAKNAVVLDIDETSLSNLQLSRLNNFTDNPQGPCDLVKGPCSVQEWFKRPLGKPIPSAVEFVREARALGLAVFFITGRREDTRAATEQNLREAGFEWQELILRPVGPSHGGAADYKAAQRRRLEEAGYNIVINIGDQDSDLQGGFADHTFKLPNPFYFIP